MAYVIYILVLFGCCVCCNAEPLPTFMCPEQYDKDAWIHRALEVCRENPLNYHCLMIANSALNPKYVEFCREPVRIPKGEFVIYNNQTGKIEHRPCPAEKFQPIERKSNSSMAFRCQKDKFPCDVEGQVRCDNGSTYKDRTCGCDYRSGYTLEALAYGNEEKISCVFPLQIDLTCSKLEMCPINQELNKFYQCVGKCPTGFYRPDGDGCHEIPSNLSSTPRPVTPTPTIVVSTQGGFAIDVMKTTEELDSGAVAGIIVSVVIVVGLLGVAVFVTYCFYLEQVKKLWSRVRRRKKDSANGNDGGQQSTCCICFHSPKYIVNVESVENLTTGDHSVIYKKNGNINKQGKGETDDGEVEDKETTELLAGSKSSAGTSQQNENSSSKKSSESSTVADVHELNDTIVQTDSAIKENLVVDKDDSQPDCNEYMKDMKEAAQRKGWRVEDVPKDGSCFYHCILKLCKLDNGWDVTTLRKNLKKYLESNSSTYKDFAFETWESFLSGIEANKWADHLEISAMADMLKVPIIIHKLNGDADELEVKEEIRPADTHVPEINIGHILVNKEGFHFVALIPFSVTAS